MRISPKTFEWNDGGTMHPEEAILVTEMTKELEAIMSNYGIVRTNRRLKRAHDRVELIYKRTRRTLLAGRKYQC